MSIRRMPWMLLVAVLAYGGVAEAQPPSGPFHVTSGVGRDGCASTIPGFDVSGITTVSARQVFSCIWGSGEVEATAGPGFLVAKTRSTAVGFATGAGNMGGIAEFHVPFLLISSVDQKVPVSLNSLVLTITPSMSAPSCCTGWQALVRAHIDNLFFVSGSHASFGSAGTPLPPPDGVPHAFTGDTIMVDTNRVQTFTLNIESSAGTSEDGVSVSLG